MNSIATRLTVYVLTLTLLILGVTLLIMYSFNSAEASEHAEKYAAALLENTISDVAWDFKDVEHIMAVNERNIKASANHPEQLLDLIEDIVEQDNMIVGSSVAFEPHRFANEGAHLMLYASLEADGKVSTRSVTDTIAYDYHRMAWYADAKRSGNPIWSEPYFDKGMGERLMTTYSMPLTDDSGNVFGVFTADVSLAALVSEINELTPFDDDYTFVLTGKANLVSHSDWSDLNEEDILDNEMVAASPRMLEIGRLMTQGKSGTEKLYINGEDRLVCYAPLRVADWSIGYVCPYSSILASLNNFTVSAEGVLLIVVILLIVAMWRIIKRQMRPAEILTQATYTISAGNFDSKLPEIKSNDEFKRLHDAFENMQISLKQYIAELTEATKAKEQIAGELRIAHDIQMSLIPTVKTDLRYPQVDMNAMLRPAKEVGGDFYDYLIVDDKLYFAIADVSGKGVPASLIMAMTRAHFRMICQSAQSAAEIVKALNNALCEDNDAGMFVTMLVGVIGLNDNSFSYCNAGHNPGFIVDDAGSRMMDVLPNLPLGVLPNFEYKAQSAQLKPNQLLLFYTDGLTEAENDLHQLLGEAAVAKTLEGASRKTAQETIDSLVACVEAFADGAEQSDDLTLFALKINGILKMRNDVAEVGRLPEFVEGVMAQFHIGADEKAMKSSMLCLALEEALANVISYAYPVGTVGNIALTAEVKEASVTFRLIDQGKAFDPTAVAEPDITAPIEEREIGGLGIHLVRNIMSGVSYRRVGAFNELTMTYDA